MKLTRHMVRSKSRWAVDGKLLAEGVTLASLLELRREVMMGALNERSTSDDAPEETCAPIEATQEVWASGVTYLRSRMERESESTVADVYAKVYEADRPEIFFKSVGWRVVGPESPIRIRRDSDWNVPEPELTLVINQFAEVVGFTAGNDVSSRAIEGENPLYLPQAKTYDGSCSLGPEIILCGVDEIADVPIDLEIFRSGEKVFAGQANTGQMKRKWPELVDYLTRETSFPEGAFLMTGTGIVPAAPFTLQVGDRVEVTVGGVTLRNTVTR